MKPMFFNPNMRLINEAINSDNLKDLRLAQKELEKKIQERVDAFYRAKREAQEAEMVAELKALPIGFKIYYFGRIEHETIKFGAEFTKYADGRTRIHIKFHGQQYSLPYNQVRKEPPTEQQVKDYRLGKKMSIIFNKAINV